MAWCPESDRERGSGTVSGITLVLAAGLLLASVAAGGSMLAAVSVARTGADQAALAGAMSLMRGGGDPCGEAGMAARANRGRLVSCEVVGEDVRVRVAVRPSVPALPEVARVALAGPIPCEGG